MTGAGEGDPAEQVLERLTGDPAYDERLQVLPRGSSQQQGGLLLGEDAAGRT